MNSAEVAHAASVLLVAEGSSSFFDRVVEAMAGSTTRIRSVEGPPTDAAGRPLHDAGAIAIVSVSALEYESGWYALDRMPIIWVGSMRHDLQTLDPCGGRRLLAADFTADELQAMVADVAAAMVHKPTAQPMSSAIVAKSASMLDLLEEVTAFAGSDHNVLIEGETGVGKELIAHVLHEGHDRYGAGPFVPVNCGAIPEGLFESLFFGHVRGAFSGAQQAHKGFIEQAHKGTLFLDELGELPLLQQVKLLRVLEGGSLTRIGSEESVKVDFRLVAATNRNLREMVRMQTFRADLFYRVAVIELRVPTLEERGDIDKIAIFRVLLSRALETREARMIPKWLTDQVAATRFHGNVRQLQNLAERVSVIVRQTGEWNIKLISRALETVREMECPAVPQSLKRPLDERERDRIVSELERNGFQRQKTADQLGISRKSLWEKMRKYGINGADGDGSRAQA